MLPWFSLKSSHAHGIWHSKSVSFVHSCALCGIMQYATCLALSHNTVLLRHICAIAHSFLLTTGTPLCVFLTVVTVTSWIVECLQFLWIRLHWMFRYRSSWGHVSPFNKLLGKWYQPYLGNLSWGMQESEKDTDWSECILAELLLSKWPEASQLACMKLFLLTWLIGTVLSSTKLLL